MYLINKYTTWYYNIIAKAQLRVNQTGYTEKHHIIPKSLGGSNNLENLVKLTAREHFICHLLLPKMVDGDSRRSMWYASYLMVRGIRKQHYNPTSRLYQIARNNMIAANKERPGPSLGKKMAEETKLKISKTLKGRALPPRTPEHSAKLGRYKRTYEQRQRIAESRKLQIGLQKRNEETKAKMSAWQKGIPKPKVPCEHCGKEASLMNHKKWHGDNCKFKVY